MRKIVGLQRKKEFDFLSMKKLIVIIVISAMIPILVPMAINLPNILEKKETTVEANNSISNEKGMDIGEWKKGIQMEIMSLRETQKLLYGEYNNELKAKERNTLIKIDNEIEYNKIKIRVLEYRLANEIMEDEAGWENRALNNIMELAKENTAIMKDIGEIETKKNLEKEYNKYKKNFISGKKMNAATMKKYWTSLELGEPIMEDETKVINLNSNEFLKVASMFLGIIMSYLIIGNIRNRILTKKYY